MEELLEKIKFELKQFQIDWCNDLSVSSRISEIIEMIEKKD